MGYRYNLEKILREHDERTRNMIKSEIKSRNRVDISLDEYEKMKDEADEISFCLQNKIDYLVKIIEKFGIPIEISDIVNTDSIITFCDDDVLTGKRKYRIEFTVDLHKVKNTDKFKKYKHWK